MTKITIDAVRSYLTRREPARASVAGRTQAAVALLLAPVESEELALLRSSHEIELLKRITYHD